MSLFFLLALYTTMPTIAKEKPFEPILIQNPKQNFNTVHAENLSAINLDLKEEEKHSIKTNTEKIVLDDHIELTPEEKELQQALEVIKGREIQDIKLLWDSTIERNNVIRFALDKVSSPPERRNVKSTLMARSVATMIQGASMIPTLFGMGATAEYSSLIGGRLATNSFAKNFIPAHGNPSITEAELIQLTGLIEDLQSKIINNYYNYKMSLQKLLAEEKSLQEHENKYQQALKSENPASIIITSAMKDKSLQAKEKLEEEVKFYRLQLERLAGLETVSELSLTVSEEALNHAINSVPETLHSQEEALNENNL